MRDDVVIIPFNDAARAEAILTPHAGELAAILIDPMPNQCGLVPGTPTFFIFLREFTRQHGILLIFDEVISFRLGYRGAQAEFGVEPDLTALGKMIGCGFPVGAVAGSAEVMAVFDPSAGAPPVPHAGTFNANPVTMVAGLTAMEMMTPEAFDRINQLGERARAGLRGAFADAGVTGTIAGKGTLFRIYMAEKTGSDYRTPRPFNLSEVKSHPSRTS